MPTITASARHFLNHEILSCVAMMPKPNSSETRFAYDNTKKLILQNRLLLRMREEFPEVVQPIPLATEFWKTSAICNKFHGVCFLSCVPSFIAFFSQFASTCQRMSVHASQGLK